MKITTTIYEIIQSELIKRGKNEFVNNGKLSFFDEDYAFMQKVLLFDDDVYNIVNHTFFKGITLNNQDKEFKRLFTNKFMNRQIGVQTIETFSSLLVFETLSNLSFLNEVFSNLDKYLHGTNETTQTNTGGEETDNRTLESTLPQSQINLNVDNDILDYGDMNRISKTKSENTGNTTGQQKTYNLDTLKETENLLANFFYSIDKKCFLQTW